MLEPSAFHNNNGITYNKALELSIIHNKKINRQQIRQSRLSSNLARLPVSLVFQSRTITPCRP